MSSSLFIARGATPARLAAATVLLCASAVDAQFEISEDQFDSWVFQSYGNAQTARTQLEKQLGLQLDSVDRVCRLTHSQRQKLQLAGRGDIKFFFEQVETVRQKFLLVRKDQEKLNQIWQDIEPLQAATQAGLFGEGSLFLKTLRNALDEPQRARYAECERERQRFVYRAKLELLLANLESSLPLRDEQRKKLILLLLEQTEPPRRFGQNSHYAILWNAAQLPEDQLKPLFTEAEWKLFTVHLNQARGMEGWLRQQKFIGDGIEE